MEVWWMTLKNNRTHLLYYIKLCAKFEIHWYIQLGASVWKHSIRLKFVIFCSHDLENWQMTLKNNRTPLLRYFKLCVSFRIHRWSQTWVSVPKPSIRVKFGDFLSCITWKFDGCPWKTTGHPFYITLSLVQHSKAISIVNLEVTVWKRSIRVNIGDFLFRMTLKIDRWP